MLEKKPQLRQQFCSCRSSSAAEAAAVALQLQQQHYFESIQNTKQSLSTKFSDTK